MAKGFRRPIQRLKEIRLDKTLHAWNITCMESTPDIVKVFLAALEERSPGLRPTIEAGGEKAGNWWIDLAGDRPITIEWRPNDGFGFSSGESTSYGEGPSEIFRTPERAAHRIAQLITKRPTSLTGLRAIRELYGVTQRQVATRLRKQQAAISRLETRTDSKVETIEKFVRALGGQIEIRAVFPDGQMPIYATKNTDSPSHGPVKSHRVARA